MKVIISVSEQQQNMKVHYILATYAVYSLSFEVILVFRDGLSLTPSKLQWYFIIVGFIIANFIIQNNDLQGHISFIIICEENIFFESTMDLLLKHVAMTGSLDMRTSTPAYSKE